MASFKSFKYRLLTVPLNQENYVNEIHTIKYIPIANKYKSNIIDKLIYKHKNRIIKPETKYVSEIYGNYTPFTLINAFRNFNY